MRKCYMCDAPGVTREHVPPLSFFPEGFRTNIWTVRSCKEHNLDNSADVEYVRNVVVSHRRATGTAQELAQSASFRSFEKSAALFERTFRDVAAVVIDGDELPIYPFDLPRFQCVMKAIAWAIYYKENKRTYAGDWHVFSPTLLSANDLQGVPDDWQKFRRLMEKVPFTLKASPEPSVFRYGIHTWDEEHFAYAFEFYGGFHVYVWTAPQAEAAQVE